MIGETKGKVVAFKTDVSDPESVMALVGFTMKEFKSVYAIVNNAAIQMSKTVVDTSFDEWNRQLAVNVGGVFLCSKYFLPHRKYPKEAS